MTKEQILANVLAKTITFEQAFENLESIGFCPNLLNDDSGRWAVMFDGFQSMASFEKSEDITTTFFVESKYWQSSIYEALFYALTETCN